MSGMSVKSWLSSIADRGRELLDLPISTPQEPLEQLGAMCKDLVSQKGEARGTAVAPRSGPPLGNPARRRPPGLLPG